MVALAKPQMLIDMPEIETQPRNNNEWYTPAKYIEAARRVMNGIDLDPASCEMANRVVKANRYFSLENDGLKQVWNARSVWLNPPYGKVNPIPGSTRSYQKLFVEKLLRECDAGNIEQAILLLLGNACFAHYFYPLWEYPVCFHDGFVSFYKPDGSTDDFGFGTLFVYIGSNEQAFIEEFEKFGPVTKRVSTPNKKPAPLSLWEVQA